MAEETKNTTETKETPRTTVSIKDIIARKKAQVQEKTATVYVPSLNGEIVIKTPSKDDLRQYDHAMVYEYSNKEDNEVLQKELERLVLRNVVEPNLKDPELIEAMGCKTKPDTIVQEVFDSAEIPQIAAYILKLAGRDDQKPVRLVDELKN